MRLNFVTPLIKNGSPTACVQLNDIESEALKWKSAIICCWG